MEIIKITKQNYSREIERAVKAVRAGKILVLPTDTVYGLVCDAMNRGAVNRLFKIKNRPKRKPLPIFVKDIKMAKRFAYIDKQQEDFLRKHWPGRVTTILKRKNRLADSLFGKEKTIGLRIPDYPFLNRLLDKINRPLTGTSANISGRPPRWSAKAVIAQFKNRKYKPDLVVDAGRLPARKPSRVLDLTNLPYELIRS